MEQKYVNYPITEYLYQKATRAGIAFSGTFELTPVCNMNCKMCYVRMSKEQQEAIRPLRSAAEWIALAERAKKAGMMYLLITGGEPFLHPEIREILTALHHMGFIITLNSNGTLINEDVVAWLKEVPPVRMNITLYGASNETYERLCGNPKGFTQVDRAIQLLIQEGISVKINCSVTPHNVMDMPAIIEYANEHHLPIQPATYMFPPVRKDISMAGKNDRFTPEEAAYQTAYMEYLLNGKEKFLARKQDIVLSGDLDENCADVGEAIRCRAGKSSFWVTWEGKLLPCGMFAAGEAENVFECDFDEAWEKVKKECAQIRLPAKCANCSLKERCKSCAAMVFTESGCFDKIPLYRCQMTKTYYEQRKRVEDMLKEEHCE